MFVIFGFYMNYQLQAFNAGAYHIDGFTQAECENMGGLLIVTGGEIRCYMTPTEYVTKGDATVSPQEQEATTFAECVDAGGELYQEEFFERCYISEEKYFDQTIT